MTSPTAGLDRYLERLERVKPVAVRGRVKEVIGLLVKATVPGAWMGELCLIYNYRSSKPV